jgi:hypothetical protein
MSPSTRTLGSALTAAGLAAVLSTSIAAPAQAMPGRFADAGTIVWCDGEGGSLTAINTTRAGTDWSAGMLAGDTFALANGETALFEGTGLHGIFPAHDDETGAEIGDLIVAGTISRGETQVLSGWDIDGDGTRRQTEGTQTPLSGQVTLSFGDASTILECIGLEFDTETLVLARGSASDVSTAWWADSYELGEDVGSIGFYGERQHELGIALDLYDPSYVFGGERLQIRNGQLDGTLVLRDPETWAVVGIAAVSGTVTETGREQSVEQWQGYKQVTDLVHYDAALTVVTPYGEWSGTWAATHETGRTLSVIPPKAL